MRTIGLALVAMILAPAGEVYAQDAREIGVYRVDFTMHDSTDVAARNGRKYSLLINGRNPSG